MFFLELISGILGLVCLAMLGYLAIKLWQDKS